MLFCRQEEEQKRRRWQNAEGPKGAAGKATSHAFVRPPCPVCTHTPSRCVNAEKSDGTCPAYVMAWRAGLRSCSLVTNTPRLSKGDSCPLCGEELALLFCVDPCCCLSAGSQLSGVAREEVRRQVNTLSRQSECRSGRRKPQNCVLPSKFSVVWLLLMLCACLVAGARWGDIVARAWPGTARDGRSAEVPSSSDQAHGQLPVLTTSLFVPQEGRPRGRARLLEPVHLGGGYPHAKVGRVRGEHIRERGKTGMGYALRCPLWHIADADPPWRGGDAAAWAFFFANFCEKS